MTGHKLFRTKRKDYFVIYFIFISFGVTSNTSIHWVQEQWKESFAGFPHSVLSWVNLFSCHYIKKKYIKNIEVIVRSLSVSLFLFSLSSTSDDMKMLCRERMKWGFSQFSDHFSSFCVLKHFCCYHLIPSSLVIEWILFFAFTLFQIWIPVRRKCPESNTFVISQAYVNCYAINWMRSYGKLGKSRRYPLQCCLVFDAKFTFQVV